MRVLSGMYKHAGLHRSPKEVKMEKKNSYDLISTNRKLKIVFLILFFSCFFGVAVIYRYYLWPLIFAVFFYIAMKPLYNCLEKYLKFKTLTTSVVMLLFLLVVIIPLFLLLVSLSNQSYEFYKFVLNKFNTSSQFAYSISDIPGSKKVLDYLNISEKEIYSRIAVSIQQTSFKVFSGLTEFISISINIIVNFFFMILIMTFLFQNGESFGYKIYNILPFPDDVEEKVYNRLKEVIKVLVAGNLLIMTLQGAMVAIGYKLTNVNLALIAFAAACIFSLIPVVGTSFVWGPAVLYLIVLGNYWSALFLTIWSLSWYLILENLLKPALFGRKLRFHPLLFFFLLLGSLKTFGLPGVIIGPVLLTVFFSLWEIYKILDIYDVEKEKNSNIIENETLEN